MNIVKAGVNAKSMDGDEELDSIWANYNDDSRV